MRRAAVLVVLLMPTLPGCAALAQNADTLATGLRPAVAGQGDDLSRLSRSRYVPPSNQRLPPAQVDPRQVRDAAIRLAQPVSDLPEDDGWRVVKAACETSSVVDATTSWEDAQLYLYGKLPSTQYQAKAVSLLSELAKADTSTDVYTVLGKALLCEAADQRGGG